MDKIKASDIVNHVNQNKKSKIQNFDVEYNKCMTQIIEQSKTNSDKEFIIYSVPLMKTLDPNFECSDCVNYLKAKLTFAEFYVRICNSGNEIYISWKPSDVKKVQKFLEKRKKKERTTVTDIPRLEVNPNSALSMLRLTSHLMKNNPNRRNLLK